MTDLAGWVVCPKCGGDLVTGACEGEEQDRLHCTDCGLIIYDNPAPTACALITQDGKLMLTKRAIPPSIGAWDLPGGYMEVGEHPEATLTREMEEETGLQIRVVALAGFFLDTYGDGGTDTLNICFDAVITGGRAEPASDVEEIAWFGPDELPANLAFRNTREALDLWLARERPQNSR